MGEMISTDLIGALKERASSLVADLARRLKGCKYLDIRLHVNEFKFALVENGDPKECYEDAQFAFGLKVIAGEPLAAPGFYGSWLGAVELERLDEVIIEAAGHACRRASENARKKVQAEKLFGPLANSIYSAELAPVEICKEDVALTFKKDPREVPLDEVLKCAAGASQAARAADERVVFNQVSILTGLTRELFLSSEGALIDQAYPLTEGLIYAVARQAGSPPESHYDCLGDKGGWEVVEGENIYNRSFHQFAADLAKETATLASAPYLRGSEKEEIVVTDPHYNALLVHEILGHPTEADRTLKMETGYAGRSWFFKGPNENMLGQKVASELVSAYSDPSLKGYGHYFYDAEGVKPKRLILIDKGILVGFMNSRESAAILKHEPNGSMRATEPPYVPLVRMSNTVFASGSSDPARITAEVDRGYYMCGHRIPSISESRENFRITARKIYKIERGKLTTLYRSGGISADSKSYLLSIDAVGDDFKLFPIPHCGKGQPMQVMRVGNGGPTMRGRAKIIGGEA